MLLIPSTLIDGLGCLLLVFFQDYFLCIQFSRYKSDQFLSVIKTKKCFSALITGKTRFYMNFSNFQNIRQPPALPYRLQHSTIGRLGLNHRVRDENGCVP